MWALLFGEIGDTANGMGMKRVRRKGLLPFLFLVLVREKIGTCTAKLESGKHHALY